MDAALRRQAIEHLRANDPRLAAVIERIGPCELRVRREGSHFHALLRSILWQQLSGTAAQAIHDKLRACWGGRDPEPAELLAAPVEMLRAAGLSRQKQSYLRDLASRVEAGILPLATIDRLEDEAVVEALTAVKGIGRWTAQMFLIFRLGRPDVLPCDDLGIRKGVQRLHGLQQLPGPAEVARVGACWRPFSTVASWYLWRVVDTLPPG